MLLNQISDVNLRISYSKSKEIQILFKVQIVAMDQNCVFPNKSYIWSKITSKLKAEEKNFL